MSGVESPALSLRDRLKAKVQEELDDLELPVAPNLYDGVLIATYRPAGDKILGQIGGLVQQRKADAGNALLIKSTCSGLWIRDDDGGLAPILGEDGEVQAAWDGGLAWYLGLEAQTDDALIRQVFKTTAAFRYHAGVIMEWNRDPTGKRTEQMLGG